MGFGRLFVQAAEFAERFEPLLVFASLSVQLFCQCLYRQESPLVANGGASSAICRGLGRLQARLWFLILRSFPEPVCLVWYFGSGC
jgi:hypothetical protein